MKIIIKTTNIKLTPASRKWIEAKIKPLGKFVQNIEDFEEQANIEIGKTTLHHRKGLVFRAECQIGLPGKSMRAESCAEDLKTAIDEVKNQMQVQLKRYKDKISSKTKRDRRKMKRETFFSDQAKLKIKKGERLREEGL